MIPLHVGDVKVAHRRAGVADNRTVAPEEPWYCIQCGSRLDAGHRFCWSCGAARWAPDADQATRRPAGDRAPPTPGTNVFGARPAARPDPPVASLGLLPWLYAAGAVVFLVEATQGLAYLLSSGGRSQLMAELTRQGIPASMQGDVLTAYWVILIGGSLVGAALHGAAFYGLRRFRRWGWIAAVVVAALWSLLIVGIPVLVRLVNRDVRRAFGVD
jgi:hypothetical protein